MSLLKYKDALTFCKDKIKKSMAPLRSREMRKKGELAACVIDSNIAEKEQSIQEYASEYPVNFDKLIDATDELELLKRRKEQLKKIINEMFGEQK